MLDESDLPSPSSRSRRVGWLAVAAAVVACGVWQRHAIENAARALAGFEARYRPEHPPNLSGIDLERVHGALLTEWIVAAGRDDLDAQRTADAAMRAAIGDDANLVAIFDELTAINQPRQLVEPRRRARALWLTRAWNSYLDANLAPYLIDAHIRGGARPTYVAMAYRAIVDGEGTVGEDGHHVRVLQRVDRSTAGPMSRT